MIGRNLQPKPDPSPIVISIRELLAEHAAQSPQAEALSAPGRMHLSCQGLLRQVDFVIQALRSWGLGRRDRVALVLPNGPDMAVAFLGIAAGAACAPLNPIYQEKEFEFYLADLGVKVLVVQAGMGSPAREVARRLGIAVIELHPEQEAGVFHLTEGRETPSSGTDPGGPEDEALVLHTSGTTARPKIVSLTQANLCISARNIVKSLELTPQDRSLNIMPLFHVHGLMASVLATLAAGGCVVCTPGLLAPRFFGWLAEFRPTWYTAVPTMHQAILARAPANLEVIEACQLRFIRSSSAPLPPPVMNELEQVFKAPAVEAYGMTEASHQIACNPLPPRARKPGSVGLPTGCRVAVMDEEGHLVQPGQTGEIGIQGDSVTSGYENNPEANQSAFINGWFRTGDQGYLDAEGYVFITGRVKEFINRGGEKISPREVEEVMLAHPSVAEAATFAMPSAQLGEDVAAAVVLRPGAKVGEKELREFVTERLAYFKVPRRVLFMDELPKGPTGKLQRTGLAERLGLGPDELEPPEGADRHVAPQSEHEKQLAALFSQVLGLEEVGVEDNFLLAGGDSILATQLVSRVRQAWSVEVPLLDFFDDPTVAGLARAIEKARRALGGPSVPPLEPRDRPKELHLSNTQEIVWFFHQLEPTRPVYNRPIALRLKGRLDIAALEGSINGIRERHEVLRARFTNREGSPVQTIELHDPLPLELVDFGSLPAAQAEEEAQRWVSQEILRPFDLEHGPLFRAALLRLSADDHVLLLNIHHIVFDAWSKAVLLKELAIFYRAFSIGAPPDLPDLPIQYADYAAWQRKWLESGRLDSQLAYWTNLLGDDPTRLELPTSRPRPPKPSFRGGQVDLVLPKPLTQNIKDLGDQAGATLFMTLLAAYGALLYRYTGGQEQILIGTQVANRNDVAVEDLIGCFINTLALSLDFSDNPSFLSLLKRVRGLTLKAFANQELPFNRLVRELNPHREQSVQPLFQVFFNFRNIPSQPLDLVGLKAESLRFSAQVAQVDLTLEATEQEHGLAISFIYSTDLFDENYIRCMADHFKILIDGAVAEPNRPIANLPLLTEKERRKILVEWNDTEADFLTGKCVHQIFEAQAEQFPEALAVVFEGRSLTYSQLNQRSNQLAHYLRELGVGPDVTVGLFLERSLDLMVGILAVLKAGGAYVPLEPDYPRERLAFMLDDARPKIILTLGRLAKNIPPHQEQVLCLDEDWGQVASYPRSNPQANVTPDNLAYVIYTSGSTGRPKGVMVAHRSLVNYITWQRKAFALTAADCFFHKIPLSFDASVRELLVPLAIGARLVVARPGGHRDPAYLVETMDEQGVTIIHMLPSLLHLVVENGRFSTLDRLRCVSAGGELLTADLKERFLSLSGAQLFHFYGPTEACLNQTFYACQRQRDPINVPIGRPIDNTQIYILDANLQPVPVGVPGELYIGGVCLARGYLNQPELTAERFIPHPFDDRSDARLYKTGDLARYRPDGNIEFLGRIDRQVKVRGCRVEPAEVEVALNQHPAVSESVVKLWDERSGAEWFVAYFVPEPGSAATAEELRNFMRVRLPDYMVPSDFVALEALPLIPTGKLDLQALPFPSRERPSSKGALVSPSNELQHKLVEIWEKALDVRPIGVRDNYFDLGGHSLMAVELFVQMENVLGLRLPISTLFQAQTVEQLAEVISQEGVAPPSSSLVPIKPAGSQSPFFLVHAHDGVVLFYHDLANQLGREQPVYGFQALHDDDGLPRHRRVEEMAAHYVEEMLTFQPQGPYYLGGYCFGAKVVFEMARQLEAKGREVALLALIDTYAPGEFRPQSDVPFLRQQIYKFWDISRRFFSIIRSVSWLKPRQRIPYLAKQFRRHLLESLRSLYLASGHPLPAFLRPGTGGDTGSVAEYVMEYQPQVYPGPATLFRPSQEPWGVPQLPHMGWEPLVGGGLEIEEVSGYHRTLVYQPRVQTMAEKLRRHLQDAQVRRGEAQP